MRRSKRPIVLASRRSALARAQTMWVAQALSRLHPGLVIEYKWIESEGDRLASARLADAGGKGLFAKAVEEALLSKQADIAVHSLKDLPVEITAGLTVCAVPTREDVRDCLVTRAGVGRVQDLPQAATLGTASPRRAAQLLAVRPDLKIGLIRGNVETRLRKVLGHDAVPGEPGPAGPVQPEFDATLLAVAGLRRLGLERFAAHALDVEQLLPAAGQGALAVQCRSDDHVTITRTLPINDPVTSTAVHAERQVVQRLQGDCHSPIGVMATHLGEGRYRIQARVIALDGSRAANARIEAPIKSLSKAIKTLVAELEAQDARGILKYSTQVARRQTGP